MITELLTHLLLAVVIWIIARSTPRKEDKNKKVMIVNREVDICVKREGEDKNKKGKKNRKNKKKENG